MTNSSDLIEHNDLIAYCGIDCGSCPLYKATVENSDELKGQVKADWESRYQLSLSLEDMACLGCKSDVVYKYCVHCDLKSCNMSKGTANCTQCSDYACDRIQKFYAHQESNHAEVRILKK